LRQIESRIARRCEHNGAVGGDKVSHTVKGTKHALVRRPVYKSAERHRDHIRTLFAGQQHALQNPGEKTAPAPQKTTVERGIG
jgi:hypothetical protein